MKKMSSMIKNLKLCGLKYLIAVIVVTITTGIDTCECSDVYFPMTSLKFNLPLNEKSQSIFSKIPIGRFRVANVSNSYDDLTAKYIYNIDNNQLLQINSTTGELYLRNDFHKTIKKTTYSIMAISRDDNHINYMSIEIQPQLEMEYCKELENICFWSDANYTIMEDDNAKSFQPFMFGTLVSRGAKYLCQYEKVFYVLEGIGKHYFTLKDNELYTNTAIDYEKWNATLSENMRIPVKCIVQLSGGIQKEFQRNLNIKIIDRNDNGPILQNNKTYHFHLTDPHFKANRSIGDKIIFMDKDSVEANSHQIYKIHNDIKNLVRPVCHAFDADHTGKRTTIISCQILFARNGILSEAKYCFQLEAFDEHILKTAKADICLHADPTKIHESDRPQTSPLRSRQNRKQTNIVNSEESLLNVDSGIGINSILPKTIYNSYPRDVYVYRSAQMYSRVTQPELIEKLMNMPEVRYGIAEDRSGAFDITPVAGIIYVKNTEALKRAPETVYFLNTTWLDSQQRSFVINVHLMNNIPNNATCEFKLKSRSQTCAQVKYQKQCEQFCGLATNGGSCMWRGSNDALFSRNYGSCVPNATTCPDNICDPLEDLNAFICPQDCISVSKIMGPHSSNDNHRGIFTASGTCTCEDNHKCSCAPLSSDEPKQKRKRKNGSKNENATTIIINEGEIHNLNATEVDGLQLGGYICDKSCMIIGIISPFTFLILILSVFLSCRKGKRTTKGKILRKGINTNSIGDNDTLTGALPLIPLDNSFKFDVADSVWEFDREKLILDTVLGEGEFGKVVKGYATDIDNHHGVTTVAVKMLKKGANSVEYMALLSEFQLLQEVSHPNVIKLLGACIKGESPMIIIEYARYGSLRNYLRLSRKIECAGVDFCDGIEAVNVRSILSFAWQICKGMTYLTEIKLVHRDLAARNVLLAEGKICKISDFGLTRDVYEDDAYLKRSRDRVPVKWMAPESLADHVYTTKSDVWAFGILCWELITLGASPYPGVPPQNLYHLLRSGYRMERPENTSAEVFSIITSCWSDDPNGRPSFKYLGSQFEKLLGNNAKYIELETNAISNPEYCSNDTKLTATDSKFDSTKSIGDALDCLDHLWRPPKMHQEAFDTPNSREFSATFSAEFLPPPGYDMPRPLIETNTTEQLLRYENDLRFPLNIRQSIGEATNAIYAVPKMNVKRGRSYMDMTNKTHIPDNLDSNDFEKHISKTISFRFSSLLNLHEDESNQLV